MNIRILLCAFLVTTFASAQLSLEYQKPHPDILKIAEVNLPPFTLVDDNGEKAVMVYRHQYKSMAEMSEKEIRLGGLRINPQTNIGSRTTFYPKMSFYDIKNKKESEFKGLPANLKASNFSWSPDQSKLAFLHTTSTESELWIVDLNTLTAKKITDNINANISGAFRWFPNSKDLLVRKLPANRKTLIDTKTSVPTGPTVSVSDGNAAQNRTYQDLLKNKNDEQNFETLTVSSIDKVSIDGVSGEWKSEAMYRSLSISPDGNYVLITELKRPFSYLVPYYRFPFTTTIYDKNGNKVKMVLEAPLEEDRPKGFMSTRKGKRNISWRADKPATIFWAEALDEGDASNEVEYRDEVFQLAQPFTGTPQSLLKTKDRFSGITWGNDKIAIANDYWWNTRNTRSYLFNPSDNTAKASEFHSRNYQDRYNDPGAFVTESNTSGRDVLFIDGNKLYLDGDGHSKDGRLPFLDEFNLKTTKTKRLWRAEKGDKLESVSSVINPKKGIILERIESPKDYPNYYLRNIKKNTLEQVTFFKNPFGAIQNAEKQVIKYKRKDGLDLSATLYLPPNYNKNEKLPMVMWAYPEEYKDKSSAGQVTSSSNEFIYPWYGSPVYWLTRGYVVLDDASFPIVGEGEEEPNDTFIEQLVANAEAAIDAVDKMGYIDRNRVAVGGHSYGAFMTANLLTHSDLFAAGIARSGAYNRTLTPFGFQSEERNYWEAPEIYNTMSPFMNASKMKHPLLLIHGQEDNNSGTYPMQSERYFNALKGLGATARLVMLPKESHGYRSKESVLHMLWEQDEWLEKHVKNKKKEKANQ